MTLLLMAVRSPWSKTQGTVQQPRACGDVGKPGRHLHRSSVHPQRYAPTHGRSTCDSALARCGTKVRDQSKDCRSDRAQDRNPARTAQPCGVLRAPPSRPATLEADHRRNPGSDWEDPYTPKKAGQPGTGACSRELAGPDGGRSGPGDFTSTGDALCGVP